MFWLVATTGGPPRLPTHGTAHHTFLYRCIVCIAHLQITLSKVLVASHSNRCKSYVAYMYAALSAGDSADDDSQDSLTGSAVDRSVMANLEHTDVWHPPQRNDETADDDSSSTDAASNRDVNDDGT